MPGREIQAGGDYVERERAHAVRKPQDLSDLGRAELVEAIGREIYVAHVRVFLPLRECQRARSRKTR